MISRTKRALLATSFAALPVAAGAIGQELINGSLPAGSYTWTRGANSVFGVAGRLAETVIALATIVAAAFIMYAGWLYLTSAGDSGKVEQAHKIFKNVGWGLILMVAAWLIVVTLLKGINAESWVLQFFGE